MRLIDTISEYSDDELELEVESAVKKLRPQQRTLIQSYAEGNTTLTKAAEAAGFKSSAPASNAIKTPAGAWALACLREQHTRTSKATASWKRNRLKEVINRALDGDRPDLKAAVSAIRELNVMDGDHAATKQKVEHTLLAAHVSIDGLDVELLSKIHHAMRNHDGRVIEGATAPALKNDPE